ncbi:MAG: type III pantothenate kinase [Nocardioidaceae bacterium]
MSLLCVSVRNAHTTFGLFEDTELVHHWRVATDAHRTADEWALMVTGLLQQGAPHEVGGICVSSTVPVVLHELRAMISVHFPDVTMIVVGPGVKSGLPVLMDNPREVGTDRVANAAAAAVMVGGPCIVVDFGTALAFEVVNGAGQYVGGAIAPGIDISVAALRERGVQLRQVEVERPRNVIAKNTIEALQSGAVHGFAGLVDGMVARLVGELAADEDPRVIATGALDSAVVAACTSITDHEPHLTLHGLRIIYERSQQ